LNHLQQQFCFATVELLDKWYLPVQETSPEVMREIAYGHAPWFANSCVSARQRHILEMGHSVKAVVPSDQHFTAPDMTISSVSGSIESKSDDTSLHVVFCHATGNVRMVMLHSYCSQATLL
jgi:hypothetical protein